MDSSFHRMRDLFRQLGLPDEPSAVERFVTVNRLPAGAALCDAPFWSPAQAQFLREQIQADADWAEVVDSLSARLSG